MISESRNTWFEVKASLKVFGELTLTGLQDIFVK